jgi:Undecaprenyl-phosphate galactose phosphotransferase WbaP
MDALALKGTLEGVRVTTMCRKILMVVVLFVVDSAAFLISFMAAHHIRTHIVPHNFSNAPPSTFPLSYYLSFWWLITPLFILFFMEGLYFKRRPFMLELKHMMKALLLCLGVILALISLMHLSNDVSRTVIVLSVAISLVIMPAMRYITKVLLFELGLWKKRVLVLGAAKTGLLISRNLRKNRFLGYQVTGFLDDDDAKVGATIEGIEVLGRIKNIQEILKNTTTLDVIIAMPSLSRERLLEIVEECEHHVESIKIIPDLFGIATIGAEIDSISDFLMININISLKKPWNIFLKRMLDLVLSTIVMVMGAPLFLLIAIAIKLDSPGPVFFLQKRLGQSGGKGRFPCVKFRTMYTNGDEKLRDYLADNAEAREEWEKFFKLKSYDPRVTGVGKWLRKTSLDELPQVINVLRGEMSLVGPRPYLPREIEMMQKTEKTILVSKPGITGLWQVSGRNELSFKQRLTMDVYYVRNWSLWMDLVIIARTAWTVLTRKGAY